MINRWFWISLGGAAATTLLVCWTAWIAMIRPMDDAVKTANALEKIFAAEFEITPRIAANAGVLFSQSSRVDNLVAASRTLEIRQTFDMPLADGSRPKFLARFVAEAGIAGRDPIEINIRRGGREADVVLPKPRILSLEISAEPVVEPPGPAWDKLPEPVRERALRQLRLAARRQLLDDGLPAEATRELRSRATALAAKAGCVAVFPDTP